MVVTCLKKVVLLYLANYLTQMIFQHYNLHQLLSSEEIDPSQFFDSTNPVTITGVTSGVKAYVTGFQAATATTQPILYLNYYKTGSDNSTTVFADGENITADQ